MICGTPVFAQTSPSSDSLSLPFNLHNQDEKPFDLKDPSSIEYEVVYDPETNTYKVQEKLGTDEYRPSSEQSFDDFWKDRYNDSEKDYWKQKQQENSGSSTSGGGISLPTPARAAGIFGDDKIEIKPQGSAELIFGVTSTKTENPIIRVESQRVTSFDFNEKIQLNVTGQIGDKLKLGTSYNTEASFDFENEMKLQFEGKEDDILKNIELGNVTMPLNSTLIRGSQSLFGIKTEMQFGKLRIQTVLSQQKSESKTIELSGGVQSKEVYIKADDYEDNRHFFLAQYFTDNYNQSLSNPPIINSSVNITKIEVWITNVGISANSGARNVIGFMDLAENSTYDPTLIGSQVLPSNGSNNLYSKINADPLVRQYTSASGELIGTNYNYTAGVHFNKIENARKLSEAEYFYHPQLGYISLNRKMEDDEVLAVAFQYSVRGSDDIYQIGEFSSDIPDVQSSIFLKMLKSTQVNNTSVPLWDLMMKNVYSMGTYGVDASTLEIDIRYKDPSTNNDINYLNAAGANANVKSKRWIEILGLDRLDNLQNPQADGKYDIIEGQTIRLQNGKIYFPVLQPFGNKLRTEINDNAIADTLAFDSLYHVSKFRAKNEFPTKNRFRIYAKYSSKSNVINLNSFSIPKGAVTVTAGGRNLVEGADFRVDYNMGQVTILNESILNSNTPIRVNVESNSMFSIMSKTLFGTHLEYEVNKDFHIGGTFMNLTERPLTQKVNQGEEPIKNTMWGLNTDYKTESEYLTKLVDKIPFINTKAKSSIEVKGEFAQLIPGSPSAIENNGEAVSFIDDFEAGQTGIDIRNRIAWTLASTPQGNTEWPEGDLINDKTYGFNRSKLAWYYIDPLFGDDNGASTPDHIKGNKDIQQNLYQRIVLQSEIYPQKRLAVGEPPTLQTLDLSYFPKERGPYNYDTTGAPGISRGIDKTTGELIDPSTRWGGIMRKIDYVDFASQNIEFIEFWVMDPFAFTPDPSSPDYSNDHVDAFGGTEDGGDIYIHIGNISEDILRDGRKSFENGLPTDGDIEVDVDTTEWGFVSNKINLVNAFDNNSDARAAQDVGFDGMHDRDEIILNKPYLNYFGGVLNAPANIGKDPAADNYAYFRGDKLDNANANVIERYKNFNGTDGNSPTQDQTGLDYVSTATTLPDIEDLNRDNTLSEGESYYEYKISMRPQDLGDDAIGSNYLVQKVQVSVSGSGKKVNWYNFRIPVKSPDNIIGNIDGFQSIRFMRMALKGWEAPVVLRFGALDLIRSDWRKYEQDLSNENVLPSTTPIFNVGAVNLEEDSKKTPIPYVLPPNTQRQFNLGSQAQENEQAMQIQICDLDAGDARGMYKAVNLDLLSYKKIQMDIHAESAGSDAPDLDNMNMSVFIRMGSDYTENYYEYEIPLVFTDDQTLPSVEDQKREAIWDYANRMDFNYEEVFANLKAQRNQQSASVVDRFSTTDGKNVAVVKGSPSMANITSLMIGVRNNDTILNRTRCAEIWVNELRLSGFDRQGGWASTASLNMKLADLGNISLSGGYSTPGWGSIDQKVSERSRETVRNIDATGNFQAGKFFPDKLGISLPIYLSYNQIRKDQKYNPLDTDLKIKQLDKGEYKTYLLDVTPEKQTSRSINFSNVKKMRTGSKKKHFYDIANFDATFAYNENEKKDINTEFDIVQNYKGGLNYNFNHRPKSLKPFKKTPIIKAVEKKHMAKLIKEEKVLLDSLKAIRGIKNSSSQIKIIQTEIKDLKKEKIDYRKKMTKLKRSKYLALYRDFNFQYMPQQVGVKTNMNRLYSARKIRNVSNADLLIDTTFNKNWYFDRNYNLKWNLTRTLKLNYNASNKAIIDEPFGRIDEQHEKDSVWSNIKTLGRNTLYTQNFNANYRIPINKFPWTSWITANAKYMGKYDWQATNPAFVDSIGHSVSNSNTRQINGQLNFVSLYNKSKYLKKINRGTKKKSTLKKNPNDSTQTNKSKENITPKDILNHSIRAFMMVRNISINYSENNGTFLPGFMGETQLMGMDLSRNFAPGYGFAFGSQEDILTKGIDKNWFNTNTGLITQQVSKSNRQTLNARATIEPIKRFKINFSGSRTLTTNDNFFYQLNPISTKKYTEDSRVKRQDFSISTNTFLTSFSKSKGQIGSNAYKKMLDNRFIISKRLAQRNNSNWNGQFDNSTNFPEGYSKQSHEVLLYSFLAAYRGQDPSKIKLPDVQQPGSTQGFFPQIPIPDWRFNYNGLKKIPIIKKHFKSFTIAHSYKSTLSINGVQNNALYDGSGDTSALGDLINNVDFFKTNISIKEAFNPLIKIDMKFHNSILAKVEVKKARTIGLTIPTQVVENNTWDFIIGGGYTIKDLEIPNVEIKGRKLKSDLNLRFDLSIKSTRIAMLNIDAGGAITSGGIITSINLSGDYKVSEKVTARAFYDQTINNPYIQQSFPTSTAKGGISIRFTL